MPRPSKKKLTEMGLETFEQQLAFLEDPSQREQAEALITALATMLHEATAPKSRSKSPHAEADKAAGQKLYDWLRAEAPLKLTYEPIKSSTIQALGRAIRETDISDEQLERLVGWVTDGGCDWFSNANNAPHPFPLFVKKFEDYAMRAEHSRKKLDAKVGNALRDLRKQRGY